MKICVIGLGYIGLPTAALLASRGYAVHGVDIVPEIVNTINAGKIHIQEPELDMLVHGAIHSRLLKAHTQPAEADVFIITVPTPLTENKTPDTSYVFAAANSIEGYLKPGDCIILESTCPIGTTERLSKALAQARPDLCFPHETLDHQPDVYLAYCPERVLPGHIIRELVSNDRIIGGLCPRSTNAAMQFYQHFVEGRCHATDAKTAEMSKLTENAFRDVNIAFANELSLLCEHNGINVWELITLANHHPRVNILQPGAGVGGHCIAVDPWFLIDSDREHSTLMQAARHINSAKTEMLIDKARQYLQNFPDSTLACFGLTFKPNIDDLRESPALKITQALSEYTTQPILIVEPNLNDLPSSLSTGQFQFASLNDACSKAQVILLLVKHEAFVTYFENHTLPGNKHIIDAVGLYQKSTQIQSTSRANQLALA